MITRAIALLIVVGDHQMLKNVDETAKTDHWEQFIEYVEKNGALVKYGRKMHRRIEAP